MVIALDSYSKIALKSLCNYLLLKVEGMIEIEKAKALEYAKKLSINQLYKQQTSGSLSSFGKIVDKRRKHQ